MISDPTNVTIDGNKLGSFCEINSFILSYRQLIDSLIDHFHFIKEWHFNCMICSHKTERIA